MSYKTKPITYRPRCEVIFSWGLARGYRVIAPSESSGPTDPNADPYTFPLDATADVLAVSCRKSLDQCAGRFEITLTTNPANLAVQIGNLPRLTDGVRGPGRFDPQWGALHWGSILQENNLVKISFAAGGQTRVVPKANHKVQPAPGALVPWMVGLIDSVSTAVNVDSEGAGRLVTITGRDLGKIMEEHQLQWQAGSAFAFGLEEWDERARLSYPVYGPPYSVIKRCLDILFADAEFPEARDLIIYQDDSRTSGPPAPGADTALDEAIDPTFERPVLDPETHEVQEFGYATAQQLWSRGSFWNFISRWNDAPYTELYTDTRPDGLFSIYLRPTPFDERRWLRLAAMLIYDEDVLDRRLTLDDYSRVNMVSVYAHELNGQSIDPVYWDWHYMRWDRDSLANGSKAHGLHKLVNQSPYNNYASDELAETVEAHGGFRSLTSIDALHSYKSMVDLEEGRGKLNEFLDRRAATLWRWFSPNHRFWSGRYVIKGDPAWRIGMVAYTHPEENDGGGHGPDAFVLGEERRLWYYVREVVQEYRFGGHYRTHLGVTRGQPRETLLIEEVTGREWTGRAAGLS